MNSLVSLSVLIWLPIVAGFLVALLGDDRYLRIRAISCASSFAAFLMSIWLWLHFDPHQTNMQFKEVVSWIPSLNIFYALGIDGISLALIILTTFCSFLVILYALGMRPIKGMANYLAAFLIMQGVMCGVFAALDAVLFYVFFEATLIPMFLIIGIWGGEQRIYATVKFFLYTFLGSVLMLVALITLYHTSGSFQIAKFYGLNLPVISQCLLSGAFFAAFAVKIPMWPVHTWLPDAHVQAPTGGSVILAAIMLKMGAYGFLRFSLPIAPEGAALIAPWMIGLSIVAIIYIGLVAMAQKDMKKLIAYSSIAHMGFVTLGFFVIFAIYLVHHSLGNANLAAVGGMVQVISHGFVSAALFFCVGILYDRLHTKAIADYGGIATRMPVFAALFVFFALANSGLPGTSAFVGEFLVVLATLQANFWWAVLAAMTLILAPAYSLWMVKRVIFGPVTNDKINQVAALNRVEGLVLFLLVAPILLFGVWPAPLTDLVAPATQHLLNIALKTF